MTKVELELLTNIDMLLMIEKGARGGICQSIDRYSKANNKYMKNYGKDIISSYLMYLDVIWMGNVSQITSKMVLNRQKNQDYQDIMRYL